MYQILKRIIDVVLGLVALVLLSPIILFGTLAVLFSMGRPVFYVHVRSGKNKKPFHVYKLRSMIDDPMGKLTDAQRVTSLGLALRKFSIDELPQLLNVLKGDMSLVGPRPLLVEYDTKYSAAQNRRFEVRPGLTGLAQVRGRNTITWDEKLSYDIEYVERVGFFLDLLILIQTVGVVLRSAGFRPSGEDNKIGEHQ
jgi:lipopolysaccharide/colanic/teichoic acid biosynthesis glycosyltransferase